MVADTKTRGPVRVPWAALLCLPAWILVFTLGFTVNTKALLARYNPDVVLKADEVGHPAFEWVLGAEPDARRDFVVLALCYTPTNVALLCILAGLLGVFGGHVHLGADDDARGPRDGSHPYVSGLVRGFFLYLVLVSGMLVVSGDPFADLTAGDYVRLAGIVSALSFAMNYSPKSFGGLLERVLIRFEREDEDGTAAGPAARERPDKTPRGKDGKKARKTKS